VRDASDRPQELDRLPRLGGVLQRGLEMTRLETFADAAFAFAVTLLVISIDTIPRSYAELVGALKGAPAFALSAASIMIFWAGHRRWSRWYGLEDTVTTILTVALVVVVLVYVYPLKIIFSALMAWLTGGWLPSEFEVRSLGELRGIFVIYGLGFSLLAGTIAMLYARALSAAAALQLDALEQLRTIEELAAWATVALTGVLAAIAAAVVPGRFTPYTGFLYFTLFFTPWLVGRAVTRRTRGAETEPAG
jgi:uncharacterized membrane protein